MARELTGSYYRRGKTGIYQLRFKYRGKQYRWSLDTTREGEAERAASHKMTLVRAAILDGTFFEKYDRDRIAKKEVPTGSLPLTSLWECYLSCKTRSKPQADTLKEYRYQVENFVKWMEHRHPESKYVSNVTLDMAGGFLQYRTENDLISPNTHNKYLDILRRIFEVLKCEKKIMDENPWVGIQRQRWNRKSKRRNNFTPEQVNYIITHAKNWMRSLFIFGFYTGQRLKDCCLVTWEKVFMQDNHIDVIPEKTKLSSGFDVSLPMHPELRQHLIELAGDRKNLSGYILPEIAERHQRDSSTLVCEIQDFLRQSGIKVHKDGTGVDGIRAVPQYGFHSCRHTFVSICSKRKVPDSVIKSIVGDSYALYTHVDMESKREAISKIPSYSTLQNDDELDTQAVVSKMTNTELEDILRSVVLELERRKIESAA